jgi:hypothetical protein
VRALKKIGMVGGIAWVSTIEYYAILCELGRDAGCYPEFSIESLDLSRALLRVEAAGTQVAFLAANTACIEHGIRRILVLGTALNRRAHRSARDCRSARLHQAASRTSTRSSYTHARYFSARRRMPTRYC